MSRAESTCPSISPEKWPNPDDRLKISEAAAIIGVHAATLRTAVRTIKAGSPLQTKTRETAIVAGLYAEARLGSSERIPARDLMMALGVNPAEHEDKPAKSAPPRRLRLGKKEIVFWNRESTPTAAILDELKRAWEALEDLNTKNARRRVVEIGEALKERGVTHDLWWIDPSKVIPFAGSFGAWLERGLPGQCRHVVLTGPCLRPVDITSADPSSVMPGRLCLLDPAGYARALARSMEMLETRISGADLEKVALPGSKPEGSRRRMSRETPRED